MKHLKWSGWVIIPHGVTGIVGLVENYLEQEGVDPDRFPIIELHCANQAFLAPFEHSPFTCVHDPRLDTSLIMMYAGF